MMLCGGTKGQGSCHPLPRGPPLGPAPAGHPAPAANLGDRSLKPRLICTCCRLDLTPWLGWAPPGHAWIPGPLMLTRHAPTSSDLPEAPRTEALGGMRGPQHSAGTGGEGRPGKGGGAAPCAVLAVPRGLLWSPSRGHLSLQSDSTCPPSAAAAAEAAPAAGVPAGARALSLRLALCFLPVPLKKRRKGGEKSKKLLRDDSELSAKVPFIVMQRGHPSPPGRKDFQRVLRPCLATALSQVPHPRALPRGDVPIPPGRGRRPPGGPSPSPPACRL